MTSARYDLILKGGDVIDPAQGIDARRDVGMKDGTIAALAESLDPSGAREVVDVSGRLVTPGLIDLHGHYDDGAMAIALPPDSSTLPFGVTTGVDAGSVGYANYRGLDRIIESSQTRVYSFIHIGAVGLSLLMPLGGELRDPGLINVDRTVEAIQGHPDRILGIKIRMDAGAMPYWQARDNLRKTVEAAERSGVRVMAHISRTPLPLPQVLDELRPGDIATHIYNGNPEHILDGASAVRPEVWRARERGIVMDVGDAHTNNDIARRAVEQGFHPQTISTDYVRAPGERPHMPDVIGKLVALGMPLADAVAASTSRPASALGLERRIGSLRPGMEADIAVFERNTGRHTFDDNRGNVVEGEMRLVPVLTVRGGTVAWQRE